MADPLVVLLRSASVREADPYGAALEAAGFRSAVVPVLRHAFVGRDALRAALAQRERYGGLVLTSPRAADALAEAGVPEGWRALPCWAVGAETARRARSLGLDTQGEDAGDAATLAELVVRRHSSERRGWSPPEGSRLEFPSWSRGAGGGRSRLGEPLRFTASPPPARRLPLLFPVGNRRREELPARLAEAGVPFEEVVVYETRPCAPPLLAPDLRPDWLVFFSPSGVEAASADPAFPWTRTRLAAIGPTTAAALREAGFPPHALAVAPTPTALAHALHVVSGGEGERGRG